MYTIDNTLLSKKAFNTPPKGDVETLNFFLKVKFLTCSF